MPRKPLRSLLRVALRSSKPRLARADGVTLVETLIAATILVFGLLAIAQLLGVSIKQHQLARNNEEASRLAIAKIEDLQKLDFAADAAIQITPTSPNSLTTNVANYFDNPTPNFTRRWKVKAGPTANTRQVSVRMAPTTGDTSAAHVFTFTSIVRQW